MAADSWVSQPDLAHIERFVIEKELFGYLRLLAPRLSFQTPDATGFTALHRAAVEKSPEILRKFAEAGLNFNGLGGVDFSPAFHAMKSGKIENLILLLKMKFKLKAPAQQIFDFFEQSPNQTHRDRSNFSILDSFPSPRNRLRRLPHLRARR